MGMLIGSSFTTPSATQTSSPPAWSSRPEVAANQAIAAFGLQQKGWMGFDMMPWVADLRQDYPQAFSLATTCSSTRPEFREQAQTLLAEAPARDRPRLRDYFAGKLGLEELSCRRSGAGAGMCDKRSAFQEIYTMAHQACQGDSSAGDLLPPNGILI